MYYDTSLILRIGPNSFNVFLYEYVIDRESVVYFTLSFTEVYLQELMRMTAVVFWTQMFWWYYYTEIDGSMIYIWLGMIRPSMLWTQCQLNTDVSDTDFWFQHRLRSTYCDENLTDFIPHISIFGGDIANFRSSKWILYHQTFGSSW